MINVRIGIIITIQKILPALARIPVETGVIKGNITPKLKNKKNPKTNNETKNDKRVVKNTTDM